MNSGKRKPVAASQLFTLVVLIASIIILATLFMIGFRAIPAVSSTGIRS